MQTDQDARVPAYQALADRLREQITSGLLRPGDRLPTEPQSCAVTGLSRSTVREALRLLSSQGLIVTTRGVNGGSFVAEPSAEHFRDLLSTGVHLLLSTGVVTGAQWLEVRETFELPIATLAAVNRTDEQLARLTAALFDPDETPADQFVAKHLVFHRLVAELTGNPLFEMIISPLYSVANDRLLSERTPLELWRRADADHRRLVRAIADRDPDEARAAAQDHVAYIRSASIDAEIGFAGAGEPAGR